MRDNRFSRQSFLGKNAQKIFEETKVAVVGLGGGGSHIVQQLAHLGFGNFLLFDSQKIDKSNLNRLIGATEKDVIKKELKVNIAKKTILVLRPKASIETFTSRWQNDTEKLKTADIIFGCIDNFAQRRDLEALARRHLIPYIDIGMDVQIVPAQDPRMVGQVILSMPIFPCMNCMQFLNERSLAQEASRYGSAGQNPQVVWVNGVLASTAVGIAVSLLTDWNSIDNRNYIYISLDGNKNTLTKHPRTPYIPNVCSHYKIEQIGDPVYTPL